jgi:hypothetical protein
VVEPLPSTHEALSPVHQYCQKTKNKQKKKKKVKRAGDMAQSEALNSNPSTTSPPPKKSKKNEPYSRAFIRVKLKNIWKKL